MMQLLSNKLLGALCLAFSACGTQQYEPGSIPSNANLPANEAINARFSTVIAYPHLSFENPLLVSSVPGEKRLAVTEQPGRIRVFDQVQSTKESTTVLDISDRILYGGEQGLLGIAFDPHFRKNRFIYLHYSSSKPRRTVVSRMHWDADADLIDPGTEVVILQIEQPYSNHNGGMLDFGPDGYLYIGVGDGGSGGDPHNHGQNPETLLGTILRLDVSETSSNQPYAIPSDNPFAETGNARAEIFAYGLRNPYRFSFDRETGALWLGDVGQGRFEEINVIESGGNYGWRVFEASRDFDATTNTLPASAFQAPVYEYDHGEGVSVTGGYVYRGKALAPLRGHYVYADYASGGIWALTQDKNNIIANTRLGSVPSPTAFGETTEGELLIVSRTQGIYKLVIN